jgi:hypothetical protein
MAAICHSPLMPTTPMCWRSAFERLSRQLAHATWSRQRRLEDMTLKQDCERCRRIQAAIKQGRSLHAAREENGWDECSDDDCPVLPRPYILKTCLGGGVSRSA